MLIHGITIQLEERTITGTNALGEDVYTSVFVDVDNVLVGQPTEHEIVDSTNLTGRKAIYMLGIPKGDTHNWTDRKVRFFGQEFHTVGAPIEGIEDMMPLEWNKKVRCENVNESTVEP